jgi:hypothetical protein
VWANKNRYNEIALCRNELAAQAVRKVVFENQQTQSSVVRQAAGALPINQRVKSAIGTAEKIERDVRSKKREKRLRQSCQQSLRIAVSSLFAAKHRQGGWGCKKVY